MKHANTPTTWARQEEFPLHANLPFIKDTLFFLLLFYMQTTSTQ